MKHLVITILGILSINSISLADSLSPTDVVKSAVRSTLDNDLTIFHHSVDVLQVVENSKEFNTVTEVIAFLKTFHLSSLSLKQLNEAKEWKDGEVVWGAAGDSAQTIFHLTCEDAGFAFLWSITQITKSAKGLSNQRSQSDTLQIRVSGG